MADVIYDGAIGVASFHSVFGYQLEPGITVTDYLNGLPAYRDDNQQFIYDASVDCSYNAAISVPYDQVYTGGPTVVDQGSNILWPAPNSGSNNGANPTVQLQTQWSLASRGIPAVPNTSTTLGAHAYKFAPLGNEYVIFQSTNSYGENISAWNDLTQNSLWDGYGEQGYDLYISKYLYTPYGASNVASGTTNNPNSPTTIPGSTSGWIVWFYLQDLMTGYGVQSLSSGIVNIVYTNDAGATFVTLKSQVASSTPIGEITGNSLPTSADLMIHIRALAFNDSISIRINDGIPFSTSVVVETVQTDDPTQTPPDYVTTNYPTFWLVNVAMTNFSTCAFVGWPLKWNAYSKYVSARYSLGFAPDPSITPNFDIRTVGVTSLGNPDATGTNNAVATTPDWVPIDLSTVTGNPPGSVVTVGIDYPGADPDDQNGSFFEAAPQFLLQIQMPIAGVWAGTNYSNHTVQLSAISIRYDGVYQPPANGDTTGYNWIPLNVQSQYTPKDIQIGEHFNLDSLTVRRDISVSFSNWYGITDFGNQTGVAGQGNISLTAYLGYLGYGTFPRFTGYIDKYKYSRSTAGSALLTLIGTDRMKQLAQSFIFDPPNLDNYYHYYAMRYFAESAGIPENQLRFFTYDAYGDYIPIYAQDDPFTADPNDPDPWGLPIGTAGRPWTPIQRQMSVLELMEFVRKAAGCVLYFSADGYLVYGPWIPPNIQMSPVQVFNEIPGQVDDPTTDLNECWDIEIISSTENTKTEVDLLAIDPIRPGNYPNLTWARDPNNWQVLAPPGFQPYNYTGFTKKAAMSDPRFGFKAFRERAAGNFFTVMSQPDITVRINTWMQPNLNILDVININDSRSFISGIPLVVTDQQINISAGDQMPKSQILANFYALPGFALNPPQVVSPGGQ